MIINNQEECSFSELELFKHPVVQSDILNGKFKKIYPITKLEDSGPIEFLIENATDRFLDLRQSCLNINFKVANRDCSNLAADAKACLVYYPTASLFQQVDVLLNGNLIKQLYKHLRIQSHVGGSVRIRSSSKKLIPYNGTLQQRHSNENGFGGSGWC